MPRPKTRVPVMCLAAVEMRIYSAGRTSASWGELSEAAGNGMESSEERAGLPAWSAESKAGNEGRC